MREILFRGKRIDTGEWIYGDLLQDGKGNAYMMEQTPVSTAFPLVPNTIGQYTGLTDKNGEKIFEGDIVDYNGSIHEVIWETRGGCAGFGIVMDEQETWDFCYSSPASLMTVIGNIHDNPELMEVR